LGWGRSQHSNITTARGLPLPPLTSRPHPLPSGWRRPVPVLPVRPACRQAGLGVTPAWCGSALRPPRGRGLLRTEFGAGRAGQITPGWGPYLARPRAPPPQAAVNPLLSLACPNLRPRHPRPSPDTKPSHRAPTADTEPSIERWCTYRRSSHNRRKRPQHPARRMRRGPKTENFASHQSSPQSGPTPSIDPQIRKTT
jgi:hypothetical protein